MTRLSPHAAFWLTIVRIYLGAFWFVHGLEKLLGGKAPALPAWYHGTHQVVPILAALEVVVGLLLVFGLFTRFSAFVALLLAAGFFVTKGNYLSYAGMMNTSGALIILAVITFALAADFGVDGIRRALRERQAARVPERVEATPVDVQWPT
ncbi:MAG: DoxX family membrane protein [Candidatus Eremiobacteraeota bacterium]|nr:DoxX family membrane protein [Candidatus Eremiobacteraeota bacterium]